MNSACVEPAPTVSQPDGSDMINQTPAQRDGELTAALSAQPASSHISFAAFTGILRGLIMSFWPTLMAIHSASSRKGLTRCTSARCWFPEGLAGMEAVSSAQADQMKQTPIYTRYAEVAPHPEQFPLLLDRMGELMRKDYDWRSEITKLPMPTLLVFADHDAVSTKHIAEFFALFGGGMQDPGWEGPPKYSRARPGSTHYNFGQGPDIARVIEDYLTNPTSKATQFSPE
jgi:pimeloyl-ACP methyl ester carboxylesterase